MVCWLNICIHFLLHINVSESTGSTVSLILIHQLDGKLKAHEYLLKFLKTVGLWDRVSFNALQFQLKLEAN